MQVASVSAHSNTRTNKMAPSQRILHRISIANHNRPRKPQDHRKRTYLPRFLLSSRPVCRVGEADREKTRKLAKKFGRSLRLAAERAADQQSPGRSVFEPMPAKRPSTQSQRLQNSKGRGHRLPRMGLTCRFVGQVVSWALISKRLDPGRREYYINVIPYYLQGRIRGGALGRLMLSIKGITGQEEADT